MCNQAKVHPKIVDKKTIDFGEGPSYSMSMRHNETTETSLRQQALRQDPATLRVLNDLLLERGEESVQLYLVRSSEGGEEYILAKDEDAARSQAEEWLVDYDHDHQETVWVQGYLFRVSLHEHEDCDEDCDEEARHEEVATVRATIEPEEPACEEGAEHAWGEGETWSHGGGAIIRDECTACGLIRRVDTWATDPHSGTQGLTSTSYEVRS